MTGNRKRALFDDYADESGERLMTADGYDDAIIGIPGGKSMKSFRMCPCGKPLHYSNRAIREHVEGQVEQLGEDMLVSLIETGRAWFVPRHYIALHGITASELPALAARYGFKEMPCTMPRTS